MTQDYVNNNKIKENKYKILRMSLILGSDENRTETINDFEEASREVDAMNDEIYLNGLEDKFYDTLKLEEEEEKLANLVDYIGGRVEQRISLLNDFANITGYDLSNLPPIKYYDKLDDYKERLKYIREYLSNTEQLEKITKEVEEADAKLKEAYLNKTTAEECNGRNEEIIQNKFNNILRTVTSLKDVTEDNVDSKLNDVIYNVEDSKKSLDIFNKAYSTLKGSGISSAEANEYKSYIDNAKEVYYSNKEQEYLLRIYKLLLSKETEYNDIVTKRDALNDILYERLDLRKELEVEDTDILNALYDILERQYDDINRQKLTIETIEYLTELIEARKEEKADLELENQKVEILSLLREFCIIDPYVEPTQNADIPDITPDDANQEKEDTTSEIVSTPEVKMEIPVASPENIIPTLPIDSIFENAKDNQVINIEPATNIDLSLVQSKASKVMKRVGEMLGIKVEETKIVSVTNEPEEKPAESVQQDAQEPVQPTQPETPIIPTNPLPAENPLFQNILPEPADNNDTPADPEDDNSNFWFPSETPDALNDLPDLEVSNDNFFTNNNILPDLNFPDLKVDFGQDNTEGQ